TSAAFRYYIDDVFHTLVREIRRKEKEIVMALEKKSKPRPSVWKALKSPFCKKKNSPWLGRNLGFRWRWEGDPCLEAVQIFVACGG
ncbi:hypothetical protein E2320_013980, partial [Naja naja]